MNEVEMAVRNQMKNRKGTDIFVRSQRISAFNRLFGLSTASAYRDPQLPKQAEDKPKTKRGQKVKDLSGFVG
jgi:hypothetical protein